MQKNMRTESGSVLVLTLLVSLLLLGVGVTVTWLSSQQTAVTSAMSRRSEAYRAAMSGLNRARDILINHSNWAGVLNGCGAHTTDATKGIVLCTGGNEMLNIRVLPAGTQAANEARPSEFIRYTIWVRNDDDEIAGVDAGGVPLTADADSRLVVRVEGTGRDGTSFVALESVYSRTASGGLQEANYSQARMSSSGANSARAAIED